MGANGWIEHYKTQLEGEPGEMAQLSGARKSGHVKFRQWAFFVHLLHRQTIRLRVVIASKISPPPPLFCSHRELQLGAEQHSQSNLVMTQFSDFVTRGATGHGSTSLRNDRRIL